MDSMDDGVDNTWYLFFLEDDALLHYAQADQWNLVTIVQIDRAHANRPVLGYGSGHFELKYSWECNEAASHKINEQ